MSFYLRTRYDIFLGKPGRLVETKPDHYFIYGSQSSGKTTYLCEDIIKRPNERKFLLHQFFRVSTPIQSESNFRELPYSSSNFLRGQIIDSLYLDDFQDGILIKAWNDISPFFTCIERVLVTSCYKDEKHFDPKYWHYINLDRI